MQLYYVVLIFISIYSPAFSQFTFPQAETRDLSYSPYGNYDYDEPTGKHFHKIKKLRKKQLLLCLLGSGRSASYDTPQGKFLFPVIQQTEVNVGHPGTNNHVTSPHTGGGINCDHLMGSGLGGGGLLASHPILSALGSGTGGNKPVDEDEDRLYHVNMKRYIIRPLYKSMKAFYRLFR